MELQQLVTPPLHSSLYWVVVVVYVWLAAEKLQPSAKETTTENKEQCLKV